MPDSILRYRKQKQTGVATRSTGEKRRAHSTAHVIQRNFTDSKVTERSGTTKITKPLHKSKEPRRLAKKVVEPSLSPIHATAIESTPRQEVCVAATDPQNPTPEEMSLHIPVFAQAGNLQWVSDNALSHNPTQVENLAQIHGNPRWTTLSGAWDAETDMRPNIQTFVEYPRAPDWQAQDGMPFPMRRTNSTSFWAPVAADTQDGSDELINHVYVPQRYIVPFTNPNLFRNVPVHNDAVMHDVDMIQATSSGMAQPSIALSSSTVDHQLRHNEFMFNSSMDMHHMQDFRDPDHNQHDTH